MSLNSNYLKSPFSSKGISEDYLRTGYTNSLIEIIEFSEQKKIEVIHPSIQAAFYQEVPEEISIQRFTNQWGIQKPYILCLGDIRPRKNQNFDFFHNKITFTPDGCESRNETWKVYFALKKVLTILFR